MRKSIFAVVLSVLMLFAFTACEQQMPEFPSEGDVLAATIEGDRIYLNGDSFDPTRYQVTIRFTDGKVEQIPGDSILTVDAKDWAGVGTKNVKVNYGTTAINDVTVEVVGADEITLDTTGAKLEYTNAEWLGIGQDNFPISGVTATATYNGTTVPVTVAATGTRNNVAAPAYGKTATGIVTVKVLNGEVELDTATYNVTITSSEEAPVTPDPEFNDAAVTDIEVKQTKTLWFGEPYSSIANNVTVTLTDDEGVKKEFTGEAIASGNISLYTKGAGTTAALEDKVTVYVTYAGLNGEIFASTDIAVTDYIKDAKLSVPETYTPSQYDEVIKSNFTLKGRLASKATSANSDTEYTVEIPQNEFTLNKVLYTTDTQEEITATTVYQTKDGEKVTAKVTITYPVAEPDEEIKG